jgi:SH2 domain
LNSSRKEAERALLVKENPRGTFLIRPSEQNPGGFSLSVKDWDASRGFIVKHYRINILNFDGYSIGKNTPYPDLPSLVAGHSSESEDICHRACIENLLRFQKNPVDFAVH